MREVYGTIRKLGATSILFCGGSHTHDNGISGKTNEDHKRYLSKACKEI